MCQRNRVRIIVVVVKVKDKEKERRYDSRSKKERVNGDDDRVSSLERGLSETTGGETRGRTRRAVRGRLERNHG